MIEVVCGAGVGGGVGAGAGDVDAGGCAGGSSPFASNKPPAPASARSITTTVAIKPVRRRGTGIDSDASGTRDGGGATGATGGELGKRGGMLGGAYEIGPGAYVLGAAYAPGAGV